MSIITLTTDYGNRDHFAGALKGKILSEYPEAQIIDISHEIDLFNTAEASYIISAAYKSFPDNTVHIIGVDAERFQNGHIAVQWNNHYFICADNGILSMLMQKVIPQKMVEINIHDRFADDATDMDILVKVACHVAKGGLLNVIGKDISALKQVSEIKAVVASDKTSIKGYVIYTDHFGNVVTNISKKLFLDTAKGREYEIVINDKTEQKDEKLRQLNRKNLKTIFARYSDIAASDKYPLKTFEGQKLALFNEQGYLEIALFRSNPKSTGGASNLLGLMYRDPITVNFN